MERSNNHSLPTDPRLNHFDDARDVYTDTRDTPTRKESLKLASLACRGGVCSLYDTCDLREEKRRPYKEPFYWSDDPDVLDEHTSKRAALKRVSEAVKSGKLTGTEVVPCWILQRGIKATRRYISAVNSGEPTNYELELQTKVDHRIETIMEEYVKPKTKENIGDVEPSIFCNEKSMEIFQIACRIRHITDKINQYINMGMGRNGGERIKKYFDNDQSLYNDVINTLSEIAKGMIGDYYQACDTKINYVTQELAFGKLISKAYPRKGKKTPITPRQRFFERAIFKYHAGDNTPIDILGAGGWD